MATFLGWNQTTTGAGAPELQAVFQSQSGQLTALGAGTLNVLAGHEMGDPETNGVGFFDHEPGQVITQTDMRYALGHTDVKYKP